MSHDGEFERFFSEVEPRLRRAFVASHGLTGAADATAEALTWAWQNWSPVQTMENPAGYLFRVGQSRSRVRRTPALPPPESIGLPDFEPQLVPALDRLRSDLEVSDRA